MSDVELIFQLQKELRADPNPPCLDTVFDPLDPVAIEMVLHEADFIVDNYMESYTAKYRHQFDDPAVYDTYVLEQKLKIRKTVRGAVREAQDKIRALGYDVEIRDPLTEEEVDGEDGEGI